MSKLSTRNSSDLSAAPYEDDETVYSVLRTVTVRESREPPETIRLVSVLGNVVLDYRDADLPLGITAVDCEVYLGNVEIIVPADVDLELTGSVFLGNVETKGGRGRVDWRRWTRERLIGQEPELEEEYERPLLCIDCSGVMGNVEVTLL